MADERKTAVHRWRFKVEVDGVELDGFSRAVELSAPVAQSLEADPAVVVRHALDTCKLEVCDRSGADFWAWLREVADDAPPEPADDAPPEPAKPWLLEVTLTDGRTLRFPNPRILWLLDCAEIRADMIDLTGYPWPLPVKEVRLLPPWEQEADE